MDDLQRLSEFRNRLVAYMSVVLDNTEAFRWGGVDASVAQRLGAEQPSLAQEYGRLYEVINQYGSMMMSSPALGVTSHDVIQDAIHDVADYAYGDIARISRQHLDTVIGRMAADADREERAKETAARKNAEEDARRAEERERKAVSRAADPDRLYRLTSPLYWTRRIASGVRWLLSTNAGRITAIVGAVVLAIIGGIVSGAAQAWFETMFGR